MMTDKEIIDFISLQKNNNICGKLLDSQLNRIIRPAAKKQYSLKYVWSLLITSFLISYRSHAQGKRPATRIVHTTADKPTPKRTFQPAKLTGIKTDISILSIGDFTKDTLCQKEGTKPLAGNELTGTVGGLVYRGGLAYRSPKPILERIKDTIAVITPKKGMTVYPNPVSLNNSFNITIKETGNYQVDFIDVNGKIILTEEINSTVKNQSYTFNTQQLKNSGAYFVRVSGKQNKIAYNTKLIVQ